MLPRSVGMKRLIFIIFAMAAVGCSQTSINSLISGSTIENRNFKLSLTGHHEGDTCYFGAIDALCTPSPTNRCDLTACGISKVKANGACDFLPFEKALASDHSYRLFFLVDENNNQACDAGEITAAHTIHAGQKNIVASYAASESKKDCVDWANAIKAEFDFTTRCKQELTSQSQ